MLIVITNTSASPVSIQSLTETVQAGTTESFPVDLIPRTMADELQQLRDAGHITFTVDEDPDVDDELETSDLERVLSGNVSLATESSGLGNFVATGLSALAAQIAALRTNLDGLGNFAATGLSALAELRVLQAAANGDAAMVLVQGGDADVSKAALDPGGITATIGVILRGSEEASALKAGDGSIHTWLGKRDLTTGGSGLVTASSGTSPVPTVPASVTYAKGVLSFIVTFPSGTYVINDTLTVTIDPNTELSALVPSLSDVDPFVVTYTVIA